MPQFVTWDSPPHRAKGSEYFKFESGKTHTIRFLTRPLEYHQRWTPIACRVELDADPFSGQGEKPKARYSAYILDHADKRVKIVDMPISVRNAITDWHLATGQDPCGPDGADFKVRVTGQGLHTRYSTIAIPTIPLIGVALSSRDELETRLFEARRPHTPEEIREKIGKVKVA